jgi:pimeloyl-ACP methyl ester carboxylesterase
MGWSGLGDAPYDGVAMTDQLHALLETAGESKPFVFVGHSLGGMLGRIYFDRYGEEINGWVGIEPGEPALLFENFTKERDAPASPCDWQCRAFPALAHIGVSRLLVKTVDLLNDPLYPERGAAEIRAYYGTTKAIKTAFHVGRYFRHTTWQTQDNNSFGDIPVLVVHGTRTGEALGGLDTEEERVEILERLKEAWRQTAGSSSSNLGLVEIDGANHITIVGYREYADQVADAIMLVVEAARKEGRVGASASTAPGPESPA